MSNNCLDLFSRNKLFIEDDTQRSLKRTKIALLGCGLSSQIAVLAARTGITKFFIADGDKVEFSNLNRQAFRASDVGLNKAIAIKKIILEINKKANVVILAKDITTSSINKAIKESDFIINTIDVGPLYYSIANKIQFNNKIGIFPINVGFGSLVFVITKDSGGFKEVFGDSFPANDFEFYKRLFLLLEKRLPDYLLSVGRTFFQNNNPKISPPQIGIGCYCTAAVVMTIIINILEAKSIPKAPEPIFVDIRNLLELT